MIKKNPASKLKSIVLNKIDKVLTSYQPKNRLRNSRNHPNLFHYKSEDNVENPIEIDNSAISKQFDNDRVIILKNFKKKALVNNISKNFSTALNNNLKDRREFKCYNKSKNPFMSTFHRQSEQINKINTCKFTSGCRDY